MGAGAESGPRIEEEGGKVTVWGSNFPPNPHCSLFASLVSRSKAREAQSESAILRQALKLRKTFFFLFFFVFGDLKLVVKAQTRCS